MEGAGASLRYGLAGLIAGSSTGWVTDKVYGYISPHLTLTRGTNLTSSALSAVVGGALVSVMIYAGDRVLESVVDMNADPLFRTTYYQSAFLGSSTARMAVSNVQAVWSSLMPTPQKGGPMQYNPMPVAKNNPVQEPGPVMQPGLSQPPVQRRATPSCQSGTSCGSIML